MASKSGNYFIACGTCKSTTFGLAKEEANRKTCPKCGSTNIIIDKS